MRSLVDTPADPGPVAAADALWTPSNRAGWTGPRLLHGEQDACWPLIEHAGRLGLPTRIGLEDTLVRADGSPAEDNADLVRLGLAAWRSAAPPAARPAERTLRETRVPAGRIPRKCQKARAIKGAQPPRKISRTGAP